MTSPPPRVGQRDEVIAWLLTGDSAMAYQTRRDLLDDDRPDLREAIAGDGDAAALLAARNPDGHWGRGFYQPKWTSTHYTLQELRQLELPPTNRAARDAVGLVLREKGPDGGVNPSGTVKQSDACMNGMFLDYASWFGATSGELASVVDFLLGQVMPDGGFNCRRNRSGARTSSVHTTVSVIEGFTSYLGAGLDHRAEEVRRARAAAIECLLAREVFLSRRTGEAIRPEFTRLHHPARWYFDVLRGLAALRAAGVRRDPRLAAALDVIEERRRPDGRWAANRGYPGETHLTYPRAGQPNRWVTLRALRVLRSWRDPEAERSAPPG